MQLIIHGDSPKARFRIHIRTTLMFKRPQLVRSFVLSFLFLAFPSSTPRKTCFSSDPLFRSINSQSHCWQLLSIYPLLRLAASSFRPSSHSLSLSHSFSRWWNGSVARMDDGSPSLCSSSPLTSVSHPHFPSTSVCLLEAQAHCLSSPPPCLGGWCCLPFSVSLFHTHTHNRATACALPTFFSPMLPPSCFLPFPPPPLCSQSHLAVYMCMHRKMLHFYSEMHTLQGEMEMGMGKEEWREGKRREGMVDTCVCVCMWRVGCSCWVFNAPPLFMFGNLRNTVKEWGEESERERGRMDIDSLCVLWHEVTLYNLDKSGQSEGKKESRLHSHDDKYFQCYYMTTAL